MTGFVEELSELALVVAIVFFAATFYFRWRKSALGAALERRKLLALGLLTLAVTAVTVSEDVLTGETGAIDRYLLLRIHRHVPSELRPYFKAITFSGSSMFLIPFVGLGALLMLVWRKNLEAILLLASWVTGAAVIFAVKAMVGRDRPSLWETDWYWGSSFPSGHTLATASVAMSFVLCVDLMRPSATRVVAAIAGLWILLVGFSRLVLGVHWPTDVLVASCVGAIIPFLFRMLLPFGQRNQALEISEHP